MSVQPFTHLHLHTEYSLLDGANKITNLVSRAKELGMTSVAMTDHGNMFGAIDFYQLHLRKVRLQRSNLDLQAKNKELYSQIQRLKSDLEYVENIARTELGMVGKDEVVYQFRKKEQTETGIPDE